MRRGPAGSCRAAARAPLQLGQRERRRACLARPAPAAAIRAGGGRAASGRSRRMGPVWGALLWGCGAALLCLLLQGAGEQPRGLLLLLPLAALAGALVEIARRPLRLLRLPEDVGYYPARTLRGSRHPGQQLPPVYPNGWFRLLDSEQLRPGDVRHVAALGEHFAVFRGLDGKAYVVDAYCPHLGANLAVGGQVVGRSCIECPFHGWQFNGEDGKCTRIPYAETVPECAKIKVWPSCEVAGIVAVWYHCDGIDPTWQIPELEKVSSQKWVFRGVTEHFVNAHIEEVPENAADTAHLSFLHKPSFLSGADLRCINSKLWSFFKHSWQAEWQPEPKPNTHCSVLNVKHSVTIFGRHFSLLALSVSARQVGPGLVFLTFKHAFLGQGVMVHSITPVEPLQQQVTHRIYYQRHIPAVFPKFLLWAESIQFERDIMVWNNKRFAAKPLLVKEDGPIQKHRRWFSQFYSENSPRLTSHKKTLDW
ncbi:cholesterol 7-desaturase nvd-like [Tiliqua scincoides]|uniref:cholesterol 7-desaturase nvd-like n=1 Tax=Tiliqua scincoides TaxID=71010 RepID=UPI0034630D64